MIAGVTITKDNTIKNLEASVLQQLSQIVEPPKPEIKDNLKEVSLEDALKELLSLQNQTK